MSDPRLLAAARMMCEQRRAIGSEPIAFLMNAATRDDLASQVAAEEEAGLPLLQLIWRRLLRKSTPLLRVCGVSILVVPSMPDGIMQLQSTLHAPRHGAPADSSPRTAPAAPAPSGEAQALPQADGEPYPFAKREAAKVEDADRAPTLEDLAATAGSGLPTCSDVLIKGMEGIDAVKHVVVIRVYANEDIDMCSNMPSTFTTQGVLQKAQVWLMNQGR